MSWYHKILSKKNEPDSSRDLKRGEIKSILIEAFSKEIPDFKFSLYKNGHYYFERIRKHKNYSLYETFHICFGLQDKNFSCSVSSSFNPIYRYVSAYSNGLLVQHIDLIVLKKGTGIIPIEEAYYFHNGKLNMTTKVVDQIAQDFKKVGLKFLSNRFDSLNNNRTLDFGFDYIKELSIDKLTLKLSLEKSRNDANWLLSEIKHDTFLDLKNRLLEIPNQNSESISKIPGFAYSLLEYYWDQD